MKPWRPYGPSEDIVVLVVVVTATVVVVVVSREVCCGVSVTFVFGAIVVFVSVCSMDRQSRKTDAARIAHAAFRSLIGCRITSLFAP